MSKNPGKSSKELVEQVGVAVRRMGAQSVLMSEAIAGIFGIHKTDLESLDLIYLRGGACSAGELSKNCQSRHHENALSTSIFTPWLANCR